MKRKYCFIIAAAVLLINSLAGCGNETDGTATQSSLSEEVGSVWETEAESWTFEVETGNTAYIPIETWLLDGQPLYGGRCVWIEKDKLFQVLNQ